MTATWGLANRVGPGEVNVRLWSVSTSVHLLRRRCQQQYVTAKVIDNVGRGDCFFYALVNQVLFTLGEPAMVALLARLSKRIVTKHNAHTVLRRIAANHIDTYRAAAATRAMAAADLEIIQSADKTANWASIKALVGEDGAYTNIVFDQLLPDLASDVLQMPIMVLQPRTPPVLAGFRPELRALRPGRPLVIYLDPRAEHYQSVVQQPMAAELQALMH